MKTRTLAILTFLSIVSCRDNNVQKKESNSVKFTAEKKNNISNENYDLTFEDFKNSKWIIGESGINGEKPDTIIFVEPTKLVYVSTDTGRSTRNYSFSKDTLIYTYSEIEFDLDLDKEVTFEVTDKLLYKDNRFFYITSRKKNSVTSSSKTDNLAHLNLFFRKVE